MPRVGSHRPGITRTWLPRRNRPDTCHRGGGLAAGRAVLALGQVRVHRSPGRAAGGARAHRGLLPPRRGHAQPSRRARAHSLRGHRAGRVPPGARDPSAHARSPVVIMIPGLDSVKEELQATAEYMLSRGLAVVAVDGPGQGEAEYDLPIEPAYERVAAAVADYLEGSERHRPGPDRRLRGEPGRLLRGPVGGLRAEDAGPRWRWPGRTAGTWTGTSCHRRPGPPSSAVRAPPARRGP